MRKEFREGINNIKGNFKRRWWTYYAYQARLDWCTVGPTINMVGNKSVGCSRAAVKDAISSNTASHHFDMEEPMKHVSLKVMSQKMHKNDFIGENLIKLSRSWKIKKDFQEIPINTSSS